MSIKDVKFGNQKLQVKQFSLDMMVENPPILLVAKRRNGKSWICRTILKHFDKIPVKLVIAPTNNNDIFVPQNKRSKFGINF
jgi:hypothetical protein